MSTIICPDHQHYPASPAFGLDPFTIPGQYPGTTFSSRLFGGLLLVDPIPGDVIYAEAKHTGAGTVQGTKIGVVLKTWLDQTIIQAQIHSDTKNRVICISSQSLAKHATSRFAGQKPYGKLARIALMMIPATIRRAVLDLYPKMRMLEVAGIGTLFDYALIEELRLQNLFLVDQHTWLLLKHQGSRSNPPTDWINRKPSLVTAIKVLEQYYPSSRAAVEMRNRLEGKSGCRKFGHTGWRKQ